MNALTNISTDLPDVLEHPADIRIGRRHHVQEFHLDVARLDRFNRLLAGLGRQAAPLDCDQVATAARELSDPSTPDVAPPCIGLRMARMGNLSRMVSDRDWTPANDAMDAAATVLEYVRAEDDLIPDGMRRVGRLDDAIVIETAWPKLEVEIASYLDYCRLHVVEASLRGVQNNAFRFTRSDWEAARAAESALATSQHRIRTSSYVPAAAASLFQIN